MWAFTKLLALLLFNRAVLWFGGGVPCKQYKLICDDGVPIESYIGRTMDGVAENSHLATSNYFYFNCLTGHFTRDNCPSYLAREVCVGGVVIGHDLALRLLPSATSCRQRWLLLLSNTCASACS